MVERIKRAGAIIIGEINVPEFSLGSRTYNPVFGTTLNAYDPTKTGGGSSGGAAIALALRMLLVCDGGDFAGSLRNPAAFNNVFGFRTSFGRVPSDLQELFNASLGTWSDGQDRPRPRDVFISHSGLRADRRPESWRDELLATRACVRPSDPMG
jgi:hypothetical protein